MSQETKIQFWCEHIFKKAVRKHAKINGLNLAAYCRLAISERMNTEDRVDRERRGETPRS